MPRIVITHAVQDRERWLAGKAEGAAAFTGIRNVIDVLAMDSSNQAGVVFDVDELDALKALLAATPAEVAAQAVAHGVIPPMTVYVEA